MKTKNILSILFTAIFVLGTGTMNAQTKVYVHKSDKSVVEYNIAEIDSISFTPPAVPVDYTQLRLNEVSGVGDSDCDKFYELINIGTEDINLKDCQIYYNANGSTGQSFPPADERLTWTGLETQVASAGQLFSLIGRNGGNCTNPPTPGSFTTGLTAGRILIITLKDPEGNVIDQCVRAEDNVDPYKITDKSFSRIPDGTGPFYFTVPTPDELNGTDATGLLLLPEEPPVDYTKLKINEVNGVGKWFEIYNTGDVEINLEDVTVHYSNKEPASYDLTWTGEATQTIPAGEYFVVPGTEQAKGLSANNANVRLQLRTPDGTPLDTYEKLFGIPSGDPLWNKSHARIPDGTGAWYYTADDVGTSGATNGTSTDGLTRIGEEEGAIDYSQLKINEVNGVSGQKWVEIYNEGTEAIPLEGVTIKYSNNGGSTFSTQWTFASGDVITSKGYFSNDAQLGSLSANNATVVVTINTPSGDPIDTYAKPLNINSGYTAIYNVAHARIPDGTGNWYYLVGNSSGTKNATNGTTTTGYVEFGDEESAED